MSANTLSRCNRRTCDRLLPFLGFGVPLTEVFHKALAAVCTNHGLSEAENPCYFFRSSHLTEPILSCFSPFVNHLSGDAGRLFLGIIEAKDGGRDALLKKLKGRFQRFGRFEIGQLPVLPAATTSKMMAAHNSWISLPLVRWRQ